MPLTITAGRLKMISVFKGAWPALITPSSKEGNLELDVLENLVDHFLEKEVGGLYLCGSTGEGTLLSVAERCAVAETAIKHVNQRIPIIVHVGSMSTRDAVSLARHAEAQGADGISAILPTVHGGAEATYQHFNAIAGTVSALPFFPYLFGGQLDAVTLMQELLKRIPNIAGAKYTGPNMYEMGRIIELGQQEGKTNWTIFSGMDEQCLFGMMVGARGNIGSTLNLMPGAYRKMRELYAEGDAKGALELQKRVNKVTTVLFSHGFPGALREAMKLSGFDCGSPRSPHLPLANETRESLHRELEQVGLSELTAL